MYFENFNQYEKGIEDLFGSFEYDLVIYDEIENFRDAKDDYPYSPRKSNAATKLFTYQKHDLEPYESGFVKGILDYYP